MLTHDPTASSLASALGELARGNGFSPSLLPGVRFMRASFYVPPSPITYEPSIVIIAQGRKRGRLGDRRFDYDGRHYLVLTLPLPFECETFGSPEEPLLGLSISVTPGLVADLVLQMNELGRNPDRQPCAIDVAPIDTRLSETALRLLAALRSPTDARILGPQIVREITYHALCGPLGTNLRGLAAPDSHFGRISRIIQRLHADCARPVEVESLARDCGMAVSTFHAHFKALTATAPLQYLKNVRLHRARILMLDEGFTAAEAALRVGYESPSQFSREFKRLFGAPPATAVVRLREQAIRLA